jgi:hypothetical protein
MDLNKITDSTFVKVLSAILVGAILVKTAYEIDRLHNERKKRVKGG